MNETTAKKPAPAAAKSPAAGASASAVAFPPELRAHFYDTADWPSIIFVGISLVFWCLTLGIIASRQWKDPTADLTQDQLLALQNVIKQQVVYHAPATPPPPSDLPDVTNPEFEQQLQKQTSQLAATLQNTLADAQKTLADLDASMQKQSGTDVANAQDQVSSLLSSLGDIGNVSASAGQGPSLDLAPTDVAIFAQGATGSRVVSGAIDVASLGSNVQISSSFTKGGLSSSEAARLSQQIQYARSKLGSNVKINVGSGLGSDRRAVLHVASGGATGERIRVDQLALPPAKAAGPGGRDQNAVDVQAAKTRNLVGGCYTIGLATDPTLSGLVVIRFTINPDGSVTNVAVSKSNLGNHDVEACVVAAVQTWKFAPGSGTDTFEYPFTFEPG